MVTAATIVRSPDRTLKAATRCSGAGTTLVYTADSSRICHYHSAIEHQSGDD